MLSGLFELAPLFLVRWLSKRYCEELIVSRGCKGWQARPDTIFLPPDRILHLDARSAYEVIESLVAEHGDENSATALWALAGIREVMKLETNEYPHFSRISDLDLGANRE